MSDTRWFAFDQGPGVIRWTAPVRCEVCKKFIPLDEPAPEGTRGWCAEHRPWWFTTYTDPKPAL